MNKKRILGIALIILSSAVIISNINITGAVIGSPLLISLNLIAVALFIIGIILTIYESKNYAREILERRRYIDDPREMMKIARKCGYTLDKGHREGAKVYNGDNIITVIPTNHPRIDKRVSNSILEALATGESSFRKRTAA